MSFAYDCRFLRRHRCLGCHRLSNRHPFDAPAKSPSSLTSYNCTTSHTGSHSPSANHNNHVLSGHSDSRIGLFRSRRSTHRRFDITTLHACSFSCYHCQHVAVVDASFNQRSAHAYFNTTVSSACTTPLSSMQKKHGHIENSRFDYSICLTRATHNQ